MLANFLFTHTTTPEIYTLSLHDALPISTDIRAHLIIHIIGADNRRSIIDVDVTQPRRIPIIPVGGRGRYFAARSALERSEEHTSELQSQFHLVCRLLPEKHKPARCAAQA